MKRLIIIRSIDRVIDRVARAIEVSLAIAFMFAVGLSFSNAIGRYLLGITLFGADEVQIYIMIWMTFVGAAVVTWRNRHLKMDVLVLCLPASAQRVVNVIELMLSLVLMGFIAFEAFQYTSRIFALGQKSDMAHVPMWIPHGAVVIGFALMTLLSAYAAFKLVCGVPRRGEESGS